MIAKTLHDAHATNGLSDAWPDLIVDFGFRASDGFGEAFSASAPISSHATISNQVLYLQETGDSVAVSVNDLHQGQIGDCFLISAIGEIALNRPSAIASMIHTNANGTETVTLNTDRNGHVAGFGVTAFKSVSVTVDNVFPTYSVNNGASQDVLNGRKEIWPQVLEKAVATLDGGYGAIANGGNPMIALQELTGRAASYMSPAQLTQQVLQGLIASSSLIVMDTGRVGNAAFNLVGSHAYMFEKLTMVGGSAMVQVGNPWGTHQASMIPLAQLSKAFVEIDVGHLA